MPGFLTPRELSGPPYQNPDRTKNGFVPGPSRRAILMRFDRVTRHHGTRSVLLITIVLAIAIVLPALRSTSSQAGGGLDAGFGDGGIVVTNLTGSDFSFAVALQPDGKILTAGTSNF